MTYLTNIFNKKRYFI